jgi:hypothetical protein
METNRKTRRAAGLPAGRIDRRHSIGSLVLLLGLLTSNRYHRHVYNSGRRYRWSDRSMRRLCACVLLGLIAGVGCRTVHRQDISPNAPNGTLEGTAGLTYGLAGSESMLYAVSLNAGVWKSVQQNASRGPWSMLANSPPLASSMAVDPNNPAHLAVGERNGDARRVDLNHSGVWESVDGGDSWALTLDPFSQEACVAAQSKAIPAVLYSRKSTLLAGTPCGLARKATGAGAFDFHFSPMATVVSALAESRRADGAWLLWALVANQASPSMFSVMWSSNDGVSWTVEDIPAKVNGYGISFGGRGDPFSLAAFDDTAVLVFAVSDTSDPSVKQQIGNANTLLYHKASGGWSVQALTGISNNGTGLGGRRNLKSFVLDPNAVPATVPQAVRVFFIGGQDLLSATGVSNGQLTWQQIGLSAFTGSNSPYHLHPDLWDVHIDPGSRNIRLGTDGGVYRNTGNDWTPENDGLHTHHVHSLNATDAGKAVKLAYGAQDNGAWARDGLPFNTPVTGWAPMGLGDANWTAADQGNPVRALLVRNSNTLELTDFKNITPLQLQCGKPNPDTPNQCSDIFVKPTECVVIQTLLNEDSAPGLDVVMLVKPPLLTIQNGKIAPLAQGPLANIQSSTGRIASMEGPRRIFTAPLCPYFFRGLQS